MDVGAVAQAASGLSGLTLNRVPFGNSLGGLQDSAGLTFNGTTLATTGLWDTGHLALGGTSAIDATLVALISETYDGAGSVFRGLRIETTHQGAVGSASTGIDVVHLTSGSNNMDHIVGVQSRPQHGSSGTLTNGYSHFARFDVNAGTVTNLYHFYGHASTITGTVTNRYGIYLENISGGATLNYALYTNTGLVRFGDATTITGLLTVGSGSGNSGIINNGGAATARYFEGQTNGSRRWLFSLGNSTAETGSDAGSNFQLLNYTDGAVNIGTPLLITRSTGDALFGSKLQATGGLQATAVGSTSASTGAFTTLTASTSLRCGTTSDLLGLGDNFTCAGAASTYGAHRRVGDIVDTTAYALGVGGGLAFGGKYTSGGSYAEFASISGVKDNATDGNTAGRFSVSVARNAASGQEKLRLDDTTTARDTALMLWDVDNGTLERVTVGIADSGGAGFKLLRIPN
jgi:hypothetical protein